MPSTPGTLETIVVELGSIFTPLKNDLNPEGARGLFLQLGVPLTDAQITSIATPMGTLVTSISDLIDDVTQIITAAQGGDDTMILQKGIDGITKIKGIVNGIQDLATAIKGLGLAGVSNDVLDAIPVRLLYFLLANYLDRVTGVNEVLELMGILEREDQNTNSDDPTQPAYTINTFHFDRIGGWFSHPSDVLQTIYDWGSDTFDGTKLLSKLEQILTRIGLPALYDDTANPPKLDLVLFEITPALDVSPKGIYIKLKSTLSVGGTTFNQDPIKLDLKIDFQTPTNTSLLIQPNGNISFTPPSSASALSGDFKATLTIQRQNPPDPFIIFGQTGSSRFEIGSFDIGTGVTVGWDGTKANGGFLFEAGIKNGNVIIDASKGDGFLNKILSGTKVQASVDMTMGVSTSRGFYFDGSSSLEIQLPAHIDLGPLSIEGLTITLKIADGTIPISLGADIKGNLGPLVVVVQNMGVTCTFAFPQGGGNLGPLNLDVGFKPPNGVGISVNAGVLSGGGFLYLNPDKGEYYGALELEFQDLFSLKAVGIINTIFPDGSHGFSMLIIITADFTPIQLGFGFTLNGVGGLLGINRTTQVDALREGIKTNAIKSILFPEDVVANIDRIISDIKQIFPVFESHFIIGPMAELGWGSIISLEIGILIEIPDPRIAILGVIRALMPSEDAPLLRIQINFLGIIDFENKYISFDASLYDSNLLIFSLTGDMAFRLSWGDHPFFLLSVGGFHPAFKDAPADLQHMTRLGISLLNNDYIKVSVTCYFAVTSNTVQFGAKVELFAGDAGSFNVYGYLGFDVLFQFDPFHFIADLYAGLALREGTSVILGISLSGELSGPAPWDVKGSASISILFFTISISFEKKWGDDGGSDNRKQIDILQLLSDAIQDNRNWKANIPANSSQHVSMRQLSPGGDILVIHPFGVLTFTETIVPLDCDITKFGNDLPKDVNHFTITASDAGVKASETNASFARANFFDRTDEQKLSDPSFEPMPGGFELSNTSSLNTPDAVDVVVDYQLSYLRKRKGKILGSGLYQFSKAAWKQNLRASAVSLSALSAAKKKVSVHAPDPVATNDPGFAIAGIDNLVQVAGTTVTSSYSQAKSMLDQLAKEQPDQKGRLQIVYDFELNKN